MAKKNFDAFINSAGKKPKPTPEEVEAMAKQLHTLGAPLTTAPVPAQLATVSAATTDKVTETGAPPIAKQKTTPAKAVKKQPATMQSRNAEPSQAPKEKVRITIDLAKDLYKRMKLAVVQNETEISAYIRQLIENDLSKK